MKQLASDTSSIEGGPPFSAEPHGWGISMSVSGEFQRAPSPEHPVRDLADYDRAFGVDFTGTGTDGEVA